MKKLYWRSRAVSRTKVALVAMCALGGLALVEVVKVRKAQPYLKEKLAASRLARDAMEAVKAERVARHTPIDPETDPAQSGIVGLVISPITTNTASLATKQTSVNPNFAAVAVDLLRKAGVQDGDAVAVGCSGSFPALNIATMAAIQTLGLKPAVISSVSSSQWGANDPGFVWLDMERLLHGKGMLSFRSVAASRGGIEDTAVGLSKQGKQLLDEAIARNGIPALKPKNYAESVNQRMALYAERSGGARIKAYINVGAGAASVGSRIGRRLFKPGLNRTAPKGASAADSVMVRFVHDGVPVINLLHVEALAQTYGFPLQPAAVPVVGEGRAFVRQQYNRWLALAVLVAIGTMLVLGLRSGLSIPLTGIAAPQKPSEPPEPIL